MCFSSPYCYSMEYPVNYILILYESSFYLQREIASSVPRSWLLNKKSRRLGCKKNQNKKTKKPNQKNLFFSDIHFLD